MIRFYTEHSMYEVQYEHSPEGQVIGGQIRWVDGEGTPTRRFSPGGEWKPFGSLSTLAKGSAVLVGWPNGGWTITSSVTAVGEVT